MIIYASLTLVTVLLALIVNKDNIRIQYGYSKQYVLNILVLVTIFLLLFTVSALRLNVGNDYSNYVEYFHLIRCKLVTETVVPTEPGFNIVCILIYILSGFNENYLMMFALFAAATLFLFIRAMYRQSEWFFMTFFLFMTLGCYFQTFSTIRYYFALAIAFAAIPFVLRKEWIKFIAVILIGATFHKSLLVVIPFYFLAQIKWKNYMLVLAAAFCSTFIFFKDLYLKLFLVVYPTYEDTEYLEGGTSYINIIRCVAVLIFALILYKSHVKDNRKMLFYFYCNLVALVLYTMCSFLPSISRMGYYLNITQLLFVPALIKCIERKKLRIMVTALVIVAAVLYFGVFLIKKAPSDGLRILPYQTFLYNEMVPINSMVS